MTTATPTSVLDGFGVPAARARAEARSLPSRLARVGRWLRARPTQVRRGAVGSVASGLLTSAAFSWHLWAGLVAAGVSVLLVDHVVDLPAPDAGQSR